MEQGVQNYPNHLFDRPVRDDSFSKNRRTYSTYNHHLHVLCKQVVGSFEFDVYRFIKMVDCFLKLRFTVKL